MVEYALSTQTRIWDPHLISFFMMCSSGNKKERECLSELGQIIIQEQNSGREGKAMKAETKVKKRLAKAPRPSIRVMIFSFQ